MTNITNLVQVNGKITSYDEDGETFEVTRNALGRPASIQSRRGKWVEEKSVFSYDSKGRFLGLTGDIETTLLSTLLAEATGTATLITDSSGNVAGIADPVSGGMLRGFKNARQSNIGTRIFGGRMGTVDNTTVKTFQLTLALAQKFDSVRVIFANAFASTAAVGACKVSSPSTAADVNNSAGSWSTVNFARASTGTIPAAVNTFRRNYLVSDWVSLNSTDRVDGVEFPLVTIRAYITTAANISVMGNGGSDVYTNWATRPNGKIVVMRNQAGDQVTSPAGFSSTTNLSQCPIVGVQYAARGQVITVMGLGDSITEGRGTYINEGFGVLACEQVSNINGVAVEWCNQGWSGSSSNSFRDYANDLATAANIYPDLYVVPYGSPNDDSGTITTAINNNIRVYAAQIAGYLRNMQVPIVWWTRLPTNPAMKSYAATDALRVSLNSEVLTYRNRGMDVMDFSTALSGVTDVNGQVNMLAGSTSDNIHPNDTGNAILASILAAKIREYL